MTQNIDPRTVVGGKAHTLAYHVTSEAETKRAYSSNWKSVTVNGTVTQIDERARDNIKIIQTCIYASHMSPNEVSQSKELLIKSLKKFWATVEPTITAVPPQLLDESNFE